MGRLFFWGASAQLLYFQVSSIILHHNDRRVISLYTHKIIKACDREMKKSPKPDETLRVRLPPLTTQVLVICMIVVSQEPTST